MANYDVPENPVYSEEMRKIETSDPIHADIINAIISQLLNNEAFLKNKLDVIAVGACHTAHGTASKSVDCPDFQLRDGARVMVTFSNGNTSSYMTLNVNDTGAFFAWFPLGDSCVYNDEAIAKLIVAGCGYEFIFRENGSNSKWVYCGVVSTVESLGALAITGGTMKGNLVLAEGALFTNVATAEKNIIFEAASGTSFDCCGYGTENELYPEGHGVSPLKVRDGIITASQIDKGLMLYVANGGACSHEFYSYSDHVKRGVVRIMDSEVQAGNFSSNGGDYAEYWEYYDSNSDSEDRTGLFVTFVGNKIRIAQKGDNLAKIGVVSAAPSIVGDSDQKEWLHKYQKDVYGRDIWEDVEQEDGTIVKDRVLNPKYDETQKYIRRADRPEWDAVGTHGKLVVRDDGTCQPDGFCVPTDGGIATAADNGFYVMERLDEEHIKIYMR